jgi:hypothetical protein
MTAENNGPLPMGPGEEWRRTFILTIYELAAGSAGHLHVDEWAIRAHAQHGKRDPAEVAREEWIRRHL